MLKIQKLCWMLYCDDNLLAGRRMAGVAVYEARDGGHTKVRSGPT